MLGVGCSTQFASGLAGAQGKRHLQQRVLQKRVLLPRLGGGHHETKQMPVAAFASARGFGGFNVGPYRLAQHFGDG